MQELRNSFALRLLVVAALLSIIVGQTGGFTLPEVVIGIAVFLLWEWHDRAKKPRKP